MYMEGDDLCRICGDIPKRIHSVDSEGIICDSCHKSVNSPEIMKVALNIVKAPFKVTPLQYREKNGDLVLI